MILTWISRHKILSTVLAAILYALTFPKFNLSYVAWFALVPFLLVIPAETPLKSFLYGWLFGFLATALVAYGIFPALGLGRWSFYRAFPLSIMIWGLMGLQPAFFALFAYAFRSLRGFASVLALAAAWTATEHLKTLIIPSIPFSVWGYSQASHPALIQIASLTGCLGVSFLLAYANAAIASRRRGIMVSAAVLVGVCYGWGANRLSKNPPLASQDGIPVALLQANIPQFRKWNPAYVQEIKSDYERVAAQAFKGKPQIIFWPETALPGYIALEPLLMRWLKELVQRGQTYHLIGAPQVAGKTILNTSIAMDPQAQVLGVYEKHQLVVLGEYVPAWLEQVWPPIDALGQMFPGSGSHVLTLNKLRLGITICSESLYPQHPRRGVLAGADVLVSQTNDGWFLKSALPYQHMNAVLFRAVELDRWLVRAANTGVSAIVDPYGRIQGSTRLMEETVLFGWIQPRSTWTFYARFGDWFPWLCLGICFIGVIAGRASRKPRAIPRPRSRH